MGLNMCSFRPFFLLPFSKTWPDTLPFILLSHLELISSLPVSARERSSRSYKLLRPCLLHSLHQCHSLFFANSHTWHQTQLQCYRRSFSHFSKLLAVMSQITHFDFLELTPYHSYTLALHLFVRICHHH